LPIEPRPVQSQSAQRRQLQMAKFNGERWELFGPVINGAASAS
jgi:hypothetical protein